MCCVYAALVFVSVRAEKIENFSYLYTNIIPWYEINWTEPHNIYLNAKHTH